MNWKSLEAYNYFQSGRVHLVKVFKARSCSILALVNPSHRQVAPRNSIKILIWLYSTGGHKDMHALHKHFLASYNYSSYGSSDTERPSKVNFSWYLTWATAPRLWKYTLMAVQLVETLGNIGRRFPPVGVSDVTLRHIHLMLAIFINNSVQKIPSHLNLEKVYRDTFLSNVSGIIIYIYIIII